MSHPETLPEPGSPDPEMCTGPGTKWKTTPLEAKAPSAHLKAWTQRWRLVPPPGGAQWAGNWDTDVLVAAAQAKEPCQGAAV